MKRFTKYLQLLGVMCFVNTAQPMKFNPDISRNDETCAICWNAFHLDTTNKEEASRGTVRLMCSHIFHVNCLLNGVINGDANCPICRNCDSIVEFNRERLRHAYLTEEETISCAKRELERARGLLREKLTPEKLDGVIEYAQAFINSEYAEVRELALIFLCRVFQLSVKGGQKFPEAIAIAQKGSRSTSPRVMVVVVPLWEALFMKGWGFEQALEIAQELSRAGFGGRLKQNSNKPSALYVLDVSRLSLERLRKEYFDDHGNPTRK